MNAHPKKDPRRVVVNVSHQEFNNLNDFHKIGISYQKPTDTIQFADFKDKHKGEDAYVICGGPSLDYIPRSFFEGKLVVCINHSCHHVSNFDYLVAKETLPDMYQSVVDKNAIMVASEWKFGVPNVYRNTLQYLDRTTIFTADTDIEKIMKEEGYLFTSNSTVTTGMHFAAYTGVANIILVGHDCGSIDSKIHATGYNKKHAETKEEDYPQWMKQSAVEKQTLAFKEELMKHYGVNIVSLNPFINFHMEGHTYKHF